MLRSDRNGKGTLGEGVGLGGLGWVATEIKVNGGLGRVQVESLLNSYVIFIFFSWIREWVRWVEIEREMNRER